MIQISGRLVPDEYLKAIYLHNRPPQWLMFGLPFIIGGYVIAILLYGTQHFSALENTVLFFPIFLTAVWKLVFLQEQARSNFYQDPTLSYEYDFKITSELLCISSRLGKLELGWSEFADYKTNRWLTLLYCSENEFYILPCHWFESTHELQFFLDRLQENLGPPKW